MSEIELIKLAIEATKKRPNSLARNKVVSHLEDALAHAYRLPQDAPLPTEPPADLQGVRPNAKQHVSLDIRRDGQPECICPEGSRRKDCLIHGV